MVVHFCECRCGQKTNYNKKKKRWSRFISGHNLRVQPNPMHKIENCIRQSKKVTEYPIMHHPGAIEKMVSSNKKNGHFERCRETMRERNLNNNPDYIPGVVDKIVKANTENGNFERFRNNNPSKNPETMKKVQKLRRKWLESEEGKKVLRSNGKNAIQTLTKKSENIWNGVSFLSKEELIVAKTILSEPIVGVNCQIEVGTKQIDFFPQLEDKHFIGCFVEYHPNYPYLDKRSPEEYFREREEAINSSEYFDIPLIHITSIKELKRELEL